MGIKKILEQLKKEKNKLDYLEKELKKSEDKKLKKEINELIEKLKKQEEKKDDSEEEKVKIPSLEQIAMSVPRMQAVQTERVENYQSRASRRRAEIPNLPQTEETRREASYGNGYGSNIKSDYTRTKADFNRELETAGLTTRSGFTTTAESKHAIQQRAGERRDYIEARDNLNMQQYNVREGMIKEDLTGLTPDLKQAKRGRREIEVYHG